MTSAEPPTWSLRWQELCYRMPFDHLNLCSLLQQVPVAACWVFVHVEDVNMP